jgi:ribonuclease D
LPSWIETQSTLAAHIASWPQPALIALDTEFMRTNTFFPRLALVQTNVDDAIALLDAPALGAMSPLSQALSAPGSLVVMHSGSEDLEAMATIMDHGPAQLFDTQIAAAMCGLGYGLSYQKLVAQMLGRDIPKGETRSDWMARPLSTQQLEYAAQDVEYLPQIYRMLVAKLDALGRSAWLAEDCQRMIERACQRETDLQPQRAYRAASFWTAEQQARLRKVLLWRELTARTIDCPRTWLLEDSRALDLAQNPPADADALVERTRGQRALRGAQRSALLDVLHSALSEDLEQTATIPTPLTNTQKRAIVAMKEAVVQVATELELPEGLLCARRHLETLLTDGVWPVALTGWRQEILQSRLIALMPPLAVDA